MVPLKESFILIIRIGCFGTHNPTHNLLEVIGIKLIQTEKIDWILKEIQFNLTVEIIILKIAEPRDPSISNWCGVISLGHY